MPNRLNPQAAKAVQTGNVAADRLRSLVERIERLEEEKRALSDDIKDIYAEAKSAGFEVKAVREIVRQRRADPAEIEEQEQMVDLYRHALGMLSDKPAAADVLDAEDEEI